MGIRTIHLLAASTVMLTAIAAGPSSAAATEPDPGFAHARCSTRTLDAAPAQTELRKFRVSLSDWTDETPGHKVGWRFVLYRDGERVYRSPKQISIADENGTNDFTPMSVKVTVPPWKDETDSAEHRYTATIVTYSYRPDGSAFVRRASVPVYRTWIDGHFAHEDYVRCFGRQKV
jgi:hypothetical protein